MKLIKKVPIKVVVTEDSKEKIRQNFTNHKLRLEQECQQLQFEMRKLKIENERLRMENDFLKKLQELERREY